MFPEDPVSDQQSDSSIEDNKDDVASSSAGIKTNESSGGKGDNGERDDDDDEIQVKIDEDGMLIGEDGMLDDQEDIDVTEAHRPIWLMRIPQFLRDKWCSIQADAIISQDGSLGTFAFKRDRDGNPTQATVTLPQEQWCSDIPRQYTMVVKPEKPVDTYVFTEDSESRNAKRIAGTVVKEGAINPVFNDEYRHIMLNRAKSVDTERPHIKMFEERKEMGQHFIQVTDKKLDHGMSRFSKQQREQQIQERRERISRDELVNLLFGLFEQQPHWKFKDLLARTLQPLAWLKEILNEICILNKRGPFAGHYELKPEFKRQEIEEADIKPNVKTEEEELNAKLEDDASSDTDLDGM